jgi:hypothetical protein
MPTMSSPKPRAGQADGGKGLPPYDAPSGRHPYADVNATAGGGKGLPPDELKTRRSEAEPREIFQDVFRALPDPDSCQGPSLHQSPG